MSKTLKGAKRYAYLCAMRDNYIFMRVECDYLTLFRVGQKSSEKPRQRSEPASCKELPSGSRGGSKDGASGAQTFSSDSMPSRAFQRSRPEKQSIHLSMRVQTCVTWVFLNEEARRSRRFKLGEFDSWVLFNSCLIFIPDIFKLIFAVSNDKVHR